jgi:hypothetical protein
MALNEYQGKDSNQGLSSRLLKALGHKITASTGYREQLERGFCRFRPNSDGLLMFNLHSSPFQRKTFGSITSAYDLP